LCLRLQDAGKGRSSIPQLDHLQKLKGVEKATLPEWRKVAGESLSVRWKLPNAGA
jgi:hypothetical protein